MAPAIICRSGKHITGGSFSPYHISSDSIIEDRATGKPYEGGIEQTGSARIRFSAQFYLVAMLFVIFDVEAVFIMLWALGFYELGWPGYIGAARVHWATGSGIGLRMGHRRTEYWSRCKKNIEDLQDKAKQKICTTR